MSNRAQGSGQRKMPLLARALLLLGALCIAFAINELLVRLFLPAPQIVRVERAPDLDERLARERDEPAVISISKHPESGEGLYIETETGRRLRANAHVTIENHVLSKRRIEIRTNSLGYRNPEIGPKRGTRILFLGDSITFGDYVTEQDTFVRRVERLAGARGEDWETINSGIGAISLENELAILYETGLGLDPDVVVVGFYLNDFRESPGIRVRRLPSPFDRSHLLQYISSVIAAKAPDSLDAQRAAHDAEVDSWFADFDRSWPSAEGDIEHDPKAFNYQTRRWFRDWGAAWSEHAWRRMRPIFGEFKRTSEEHGFELYIVAFPVAYQVSARYLNDWPQQRLAEIAGALDIELLDLLPLFRGVYGQTDDPLFYDLCHHTPIGNALIARAITDFLVPRIGAAGDSTRSAQAKLGD
jgi:hypothetical protein